MTAVAFSLDAAPQRVVGSGYGSNSRWATDHYPGFEGLDRLPVPEKKEKGWLRDWLGIGAPDGATAQEQFAVAKKLEDEGDFKDAAKAYDALVREWPASPEAPEAQLRLASILESHLAEYADAYEEYAYLLDFYPRDCNFSEIAEAQYKLVNLLLDTRRTFLGMFDPSARPLVPKNELSFAVPMSRFREMLATMPNSALFEHAFSVVRKRINGEIK